VKQGKYADPEVQRQVSKILRCVEEYELGLADVNDRGEIPTIDKVFKTNKIKKGKSGDMSDLVSIVNAIEQGFELKPGRKSKRASGKKTEGGVTEIDVS